jgi:hypothetical protein
LEFERERNRTEALLKDETKRVKEDSKAKLFAIVEQHKVFTAPRGVRCPLFTVEFRSNNWRRLESTRKKFVI